jgi:hypothetical protein
MGWASIAQEASQKYIFLHSHPEQADFVLGGHSVLPCGLQGRREVHPLDPSCWELAQEFSPGTLGCDSYVDMFDAFWVPFSGFSGQVRGGPEIQIFRKGCSPYLR